MDFDDNGDLENKIWLPICNSQGFMYFYNKSTGECQWGYPKVYDSSKQKYVCILYNFFN